jgi:hypothetical protein
MMLASLTLSVFATFATFACAAERPANLLFNGDFSACAKPGGAPDGWEFSGDPKFVQATLAQDQGPDGGKSIRLDCTAYSHGSGWSHAMVCQVDKTQTREDYHYTVRFQAKARGIADFHVAVAMQEMREWKPLGLRQWFTPTEQWAWYEFTFVALRDCREKARFQISYNSTGTLWLANASITEGAPPVASGPRHPTHVWPAAGGNLIPNAGFECGPAGWGSQTAEYITWGTPMDRLFGEVATNGAFEGQRCLRITLNQQVRPLVNFDCYEPVCVPVQAPLAGHLGYVAVEAGKPYTLSAWMRADAEDTPARLGVQQFLAGTDLNKVRVGTEWKRYSHTFKPRTNFCYALVGPDLRDSGRTGCVLWVDAIQLEEGGAPRPFALRAPVETSMRMASAGPVCFDGDKLAVIVAAVNNGKEWASLKVALHLSDFWDRRAGLRDAGLSLAPGASVEHVLDLGAMKRGYYRVQLTVNGVQQPGELRFAVIPKYTRPDSIFGINHAYGWPELVKAGRDAGIVWARDWSMAWQNVESAPGRWTFTETDLQVNRARNLGQLVLGLLPFPSSDWSSSAPPPDPAVEKFKARRLRQSYAARDMEQYRTYVSNCVSHCRERIWWWHVLNEPLYTEYALPRKCGYTPADYLRHVKLFHEAAKAANPDCRVLAGPGNWLGDDLQEMLRLGLQQHCDAVDLHIYPGFLAPEKLEADLVRIRALQAQYGPRRPLWLTEHGYYADDDLNMLPPDRNRFPEEMLPSEQVQAEYSMRFNLLLLANGVEKIFYHAGTAEPLSRDQVQGIFFRYAGEPRKIYPALAAMAELFQPGTKFVKDLSPAGSQARALLFQSGDRLVLGAWQPAANTPAGMRVSGTQIALRDLMGNLVTGKEVELVSSPVYAVATGISAAEFEKAVEIR